VLHELICRISSGTPESDFVGILFNHEYQSEKEGIKAVNVAVKVINLSRIDGRAPPCVLLAFLCADGEIATTLQAGKWKVFSLCLVGFALLILFSIGDYY
jgi:hypothetical protein